VPRPRRTPRPWHRGRIACRSAPAAAPPPSAAASGELPLSSSPLSRGRGRRRGARPTAAWVRKSFRPFASPAATSAASWSLRACSWFAAARRSFVRSAVRSAARSSRSVRSARLDSATPSARACRSSERTRGVVVTSPLVELCWGGALVGSSSPVRQPHVPVPPDQQLLHQRPAAKQGT
jgi:hypothetical protein